MSLSFPLCFIVVYILDDVCFFCYVAASFWYSLFLWSSIDIVFISCRNVLFPLANSVLYPCIWYRWYLQKKNYKKIPFSHIQFEASHSFFPDINPYILGAIINQSFLVRLVCPIAFGTFSAILLFTRLELYLNCALVIYYFFISIFNSCNVGVVWIMLPVFY